MEKTKDNQQQIEMAVEVLKDILITQLGLAGVPQTSIRKIVGCSMNRVNNIVKHFKSSKRGSDDEDRR